jgi:branched-chain amino acid transport system substrate-binding protein
MQGLRLPQIGRSARLVSLAAVLAVLVSLGVSSATAAKRAETAGTITVGAILPFSGTLSYYGQEYRRGMDMAAAYINQHGGLGGGKKLAMKYVDGPNAAAQADGVRSLNAQGIKIYAGTGSSSFDLADATVGDQLHMLGWLFGVDRATADKHPEWVVQPSPTTEYFTRPAIQILATIPKRMGKKSRDLKVAIVCSNDAYGQSNCAAYKSYVNGHMKANIVLEQYYDRAATDLSPVVLRLQAAQPDVVLQTGYTDDVVTMWRQAKQVGYQPKWFLGSGGTATTNFVNALGDWANGFIAVSYAMPSKGAPKSVAFANKYKDIFGEALPSGHAMMVYSGMLKLADAIRAAKGSDDPKTIIAAAEKMLKPTFTYPDGCGFRLYQHRNVRCSTVAMQWQDQKLRMVWPSQFAETKIIGPLPVK